MNRLVLVLVSVLVVSACTTGDRRQAKYLQADYLTQLELPPNLIADEARVTRSQLNLPKPTETAISSYRTGVTAMGGPEEKAVVAEKKEPQVAPVFEGLRLRSDGDLHWLEIDRNADDIWPLLTDFWSHEGVSLMTNEPLLGFMETDWIVKYQVSEEEGFFARMAKRLDKDKTDRFRMRVSRGDGAGQTRVSITHSGRQNIVGDDVSYMAPRASEAQLEVELLSRLLVYMGLTRQDATALLRSYKPFAKRAQRSTVDEATMEMTGDTAFVWPRVLRAIDRLGFEVAEKDETRHELKVVIQKLTTEHIGGERDEIAESSFIMKWLGGENGDANKDETRQFYLKLEPQDKFVRLQVRNLQREPADSVLADQFIKSLLIELD